MECGAHIFIIILLIIGIILLLIYYRRKENNIFSGGCSRYGKVDCQNLKGIGCLWNGSNCVFND